MFLLKSLLLTDFIYRITHHAICSTNNYKVKDSQVTTIVTLFHSITQTIYNIQA